MRLQSASIISAPKRECLRDQCSEKRIGSRRGAVAEKYSGRFLSNKHTHFAAQHYLFEFVNTVEKSWKAAGAVRCTGYRRTSTMTHSIKHGAKLPAQRTALRAHHRKRKSLHAPDGGPVYAVKLQGLRPARFVGNELACVGTGGVHRCEVRRLRYVGYIETHRGGRWMCEKKKRS